MPILHFALEILLSLCVGRREKTFFCLIYGLWTAPNTAKVKLDLKPHRHERSRLPCPGSMLRTCRGAKHFMKSQLQFQKSLILCSLESENLLWILVTFLRVLKVRKSRKKYVVLDSSKKRTLGQFHVLKIASVVRGPNYPISSALKTYS